MAGLGRGSFCSQQNCSCIRRPQDHSLFRLSKRYLEGLFRRCALTRFEASLSRGDISCSRTSQEEHLATRGNEYHQPAGRHPRGARPLRSGRAPARGRAAADARRRGGAPRAGWESAAVRAGARAAPLARTHRHGHDAIGLDDGDVGASDVPGARACPAAAAAAPAAAAAAHHHLLAAWSETARVGRRLFAGGAQKEDCQIPREAQASPSCVEINQ